MPDSRSPLIDLELEFVHQTELAILVSDGDTQAWLPKAAVEFRMIKPGIVEVTLTEKLATEKGLT